MKALRHWLCDGNSPVTGEFPAKKASNEENASIWWRYDGNPIVPLATLRPRHLQRHFQIDFFYEYSSSVIQISWKFDDKGPMIDILALVPIMVWRRINDKQLSESMMA